MVSFIEWWKILRNLQKPMTFKFFSFQIFMQEVYKKVCKPEFKRNEVPNQIFVKTSIPCQNNAVNDRINTQRLFLDLGKLKMKSNFRI